MRKTAGILFAMIFTIIAAFFVQPQVADADGTGTVMVTGLEKAVAKVTVPKSCL